MKKRKIVNVILGLSVVGFILGFLFWTEINRKSLLEQCHHVHEVDNFHIHSILEIMQDGKKVLVPENVGVVGECVHPVHTHDTTGLVHVDYPKKIDFNLGDFFDVQGVIFNDKQIGSVKKSDGFVVKVYVDGKEIPENYRGIKLVDRRKILINIISPKTITE